MITTFLWSTRREAEIALDENLCRSHEGLARGRHPGGVKKAINEEELRSLGGVYGNKWAGDPLE